ncbi:helix-turn-helix domain-containing protein [Lysinibacillus telephonicus]|uniref:Rgg/GadR/MutR family transcriptional regulator n=1 Tax=Lysinibacillus telephonicus TaxID=1714840 RepID=A0A3S0QT24_9BACI|nr:Rgg/GadR/MutR family transcriptional regulator [Lysinibacillus telephonicus]RTQ90966.1 Rgg/GadR/MutR family transcriptional regulator [Lysinibacillus telephonicus]
MEIGQVIRKIRKNKNITQQQLADAINMTRPYIARIESGKNSISSDKLTEILDYCNVTYNEFFYMKNDYKIASKMNEFNYVLKLYYANKINEISIMKKGIREKYEGNGDIFLRHLYILCHCIENGFELNSIKEEYINEISDYLLSIDDWSYYELVILNNFIFLFPPSTAFLMTKNLLNRAEKFNDFNSDTKIMSYLFFNLLEFSIKYEGYQYSRIVLEAAKKYFTESSQFFEQTLIIFYEGMIDIIDHSISKGIEKCNKAFTIFQTLGHQSIYEKYKKDLDQLINKTMSTKA